MNHPPPTKPNPNLSFPRRTGQQPRRPSTGSTGSHRSTTSGISNLSMGTANNNYNHNNGSISSSNMNGHGNRIPVVGTGSAQPPVGLKAPMAMPYRPTTSSNSTHIGGNGNSATPSRSNTNNRMTNGGNPYNSRVTTSTNTNTNNNKNNDPVLSPIKPVPPPSKKQKANPHHQTQQQQQSSSETKSLASATSKEFMTMAEQAIARRRAELRRLQQEQQQQQQASSTGGGGRSSAAAERQRLVERARALTSSARARVANANNSSNGGGGGSNNNGGVKSLSVSTATDGIDNAPPPLSASAAASKSTSVAIPPPSTKSVVSAMTTSPSSIVSTPAANVTAPATLKVVSDATRDSKLATATTAPTAASTSTSTSTSTGNVNYPTRSQPVGDTGRNSNASNHPPPSSSSSSSHASNGPPQPKTPERLPSESTTVTTSTDTTIANDNDNNNNHNNNLSASEEEEEEPTIVPPPTVPNTATRDKPPTTTTNTSAKPTKSKRQDTFLSLRNGVPSPAPHNPPPPSSNEDESSNYDNVISTELQMVKELKESKEQVTKLLNRITELEKENTATAIKNANGVINGINNGKKQQQQQQQPTISEKEVWNKMLEIASKDGKDAALLWAARNHHTLSKHDNSTTTSNGTSPIRFPRDPPNLLYDYDDDSSHLTDITPVRGRGRSSLRSSGRRRRLKSPQPTKRNTTSAADSDGNATAANNTNDDNNPLERFEIASRAVMTVEDVYKSDLARFYFRKPYGGNETMIWSVGGEKGEKENDNDNTNDRISWITPVESYLKSATVRDETTLEVIAKIDADSSIMILYGACNVRHGTPDLGDDGSVEGYHWKTFHDIDDMDGSLGSMTYIDMDGNEGEYYLDQIYEEAIKIREQYCTNVCAAARAFQETSSKEEEGRIEASSGQEEETSRLQSPSHGLLGSGGKVTSAVSPETMTKKPMTADKCVGTEDLLQPIPKKVTTRANKQKPASKKRGTAIKQKVQMDDDSGSVDAFTAFLLFFFSTIFRTVTFFTIRLPLKIVWYSVLTLLVYGLITISWLYMADDNGAMEMGPGGFDFQFLPPSMRD